MRLPIQCGTLSTHMQSSVAEWVTIILLAKHMHIAHRQCEWLWSWCHLIAISGHLMAIVVTWWGRVSWEHVSSSHLINDCGLIRTPI